MARLSLTADIYVPHEFGLGSLEAAVDQAVAAVAVETEDPGRRARRAIDPVFERLRDRFVGVTA